MTWPRDGLPRYVWACDPPIGKRIHTGRGYVYDRARCCAVVAVFTNGLNAARALRECDRLNSAGGGEKPA